MCTGISMVITRGRIEPYWIPGNNSHSDIRKKYNIRDDETIPSLPIEFHPTGVLTNKEDWVFYIDSNCPRPAWFTEQKHEYIDACTCVLHKIIDDINNTGVYDGNLNLSDTRITSLGNLTSCGNLDLSDTRITSLGNLTSCGDLNLYGTPITSLGKLTSCGNLYLYHTPITDEDIANIKYDNVYR